MKLPWVSREAYDERGRRLAQLEAEITRLTELRLQGFVAAKPGRVREPPDPETQARHRAETEFVNKARAKLMADTGVDTVTATREAERLRREVTDQQAPGG